MKRIVVAALGAFALAGCGSGSGNDIRAGEDACTAMRRVEQEIQEGKRRYLPTDVGYGCLRQRERERPRTR